MRRLRGESGFTLIETLIGVSMSVVILGATMSILIVAMHGETASTQRNDAQDHARLTIDLIARQLRNIASPISSPKLIERASAYDIVFQTVGTPSGSNSSGAERVRYCIPDDTATGNASNEALYNQTQTWTGSTPPAIPWGSSCPDTTSSTAIVIPSVTNRYKQRTDRPAFSFNNSVTPPSNLSTITSVQMDIFVNPTTQTPAAESELRSGVFLRNQLRPPIANFSYVATGNGMILLNGGASYSPDDEDLSYKWACLSSPCPNSSDLTGASDALVYTWHPGAGTFNVQLTVTDPNGLSATTTQAVTVT